MTNAHLYDKGVFEFGKNEFSYLVLTEGSTYANYKKNLTRVKRKEERKPDIIIQESEYNLPIREQVLLYRAIESIIPSSEHAIKTTLLILFHTMSGNALKRTIKELKHISDSSTIDDALEDIKTKKHKWAF